jgi:AraC-like DNA-binding protein
MPSGARHTRAVISADLLARLCRARRRIESDLECPPAIGVLAREAGLTTPHFITQFRAVFGQTPVQCRTRARLERARALLAAGDESITQICLALGFASPGSFSRMFSRHFGRPPRALRREGATPISSPAGCVALMNLARGASEIPAKSARPRGGMIAP